MGKLRLRWADNIGSDAYGFRVADEWKITADRIHQSSGTAVMGSEEAIE